MSVHVELTADVDIPAGLDQRSDIVQVREPHVPDPSIVVKVGEVQSEKAARKWVSSVR
jgi:hypothetical protein